MISGTLQIKPDIYHEFMHTAKKGQSFHEFRSTANEARLKCI